jgi:hypothetical protein
MPAAAGAAKSPQNEFCGQAPGRGWPCACPEGAHKGRPYNVVPVMAQYLFAVVFGQDRSGRTWRFDLQEFDLVLHLVWLQYFKD